MTSKFKFQNLEEKENIIKDFESKRETLSKVKENGNVTFFTFTLDKDSKIPDKEESEGEILVAFFKEPHILTKVRAMDTFYSGKISECGLTLYETCLIKEETSDEVQSNQKYQIGLFPRLAKIIEASVPDVKKN